MVICFAAAVNLYIARRLYGNISENFKAILKSSDISYDSSTSRTNLAYSMYYASKLVAET